MQGMINIYSYVIDKCSEIRVLVYTHLILHTFSIVASSLIRS